MTMMMSGSFSSTAVRLTGATLGEEVTISTSTDIDGLRFKDRSMMMMMIMIIMMMMMTMRQLFKKDQPVPL